MMYITSSYFIIRYKVKISISDRDTGNRNTKLPHTILYYLV